MNASTNSTTSSGTKQDFFSVLNLTKEICKHQTGVICLHTCDSKFCTLQENSQPLKNSPVCDFQLPKQHWLVVYQEQKSLQKLLFNPKIVFLDWQRPLVNLTPNANRWDYYKNLKSYQCSFSCRHVLKWCILPSLFRANSFLLPHALPF